MNAFDTHAPVDIHELFAENLQRDAHYVEELRKLELGYLGRLFRLLPSGLNRLRRFIATRFDPGRVVGALCLALIIFNIVYFGGQLVRWAVS